MCLEIEAVTAANSIQMFLAQSRKPKQSKQTIWALASKQSSRGSGGAGAGVGDKGAVIRGNSG